MVVSAKSEQCRYIPVQLQCKTPIQEWMSEVLLLCCCAVVSAAVATLHISLVLGLIKHYLILSDLIWSDLPHSGLTMKQHSELWRLFPEAEPKESTLNYYMKATCIRERKYPTSSNTPKKYFIALCFNTLYNFVFVFISHWA